MGSSRKTFAEISLAQLEKNVEYIKSHFHPDAFFCPMVKANGYGHGDVEITKSLEKAGVNAVGVVTYEEGAGLRAAGIQSEILVFGVVDPSLLTNLLNERLTPVLSHMEQLKVLAKTVKIPTSVHLKFNTAMNRLGFMSEDVSRIREYLDQNKNIHVAGICTHFLNGEDFGETDGYTDKQIASIHSIFEKLGCESAKLHYVNSSCLLKAIEKNTTHKIREIGVRPGITIYGESPFVGRRSESVKPILSWKSQLELIRNVRSGEVVSYGPRWKAEKETLVGIVSVGYADGYPRLLTNKSKMIVNGKKVPVIGTICMDYCMLDLTGVEGEIKLGQPVTVVGEEFGQRITVQDLAEAYGSIPYEILTRLGQRVTRVYKR